MDIVELMNLTAVDISEMGYEEIRRHIVSCDRCIEDAEAALRRGPSSHSYDGWYEVRRQRIKSLECVKIRLTGAENKCPEAKKANEEKREIEYLNALHKRCVCKYCDRKISNINGNCQCGKSNPYMCNQCGGKHSKWSGKCKKCGKKIQTCLYCGGEMELSTGFCNSCGRARAY